MSADDRLPADMLLLRERRRRMTSSSEPVLLESDAIVDGFASEELPARDGALHLYRSLGSVTLAAMTWTGAIDHAALQRAIACAQLEGPFSAFSSGWFARVSTANALPPHGEAALLATLSTSDVELLERASSNHAAPVVERLGLASLLPSTIVGADDPTIEAATVVLTTYRRASLVVAWLDAIGGDAGADATSRRDEAAAAAMSMLRALLGEA
ncbi:MAG TPA: hypothetical protein VFO25_12535 [Candidatus Eremiobacteraceae bacterium]|nr:hypothetical protein [Candidatus Eremiobacteraceae bacterium]